MQSEIDTPVEHAGGKYTAAEKIAALGSHAREVGDQAALAQINSHLKSAMKKAGLISNPVDQSTQADGWEPISPQKRAQIESMPTEVWYVDPHNRKKKEVSGRMPQFPPLSQTEVSEVLYDLKPVNSIVEQPTNLTNAEWEKILVQVPNFEGDVRKGALFMHELAYGILATKNKRAVIDGDNKYDVPSIVIYYGKNKDKLGIYYAASTNQIIVSSSHLASYTQFNESDRVTLRSDVAGNDVVFDGRIGNWARLIGVEEATHAATNQVKPITSFVSDRRSLGSLAEYDARDEEYEGLLEQLDFAKREKMDPETIQVIVLRIRNAQQLRKMSGK